MFSDKLISSCFGQRIFGVKNFLGLKNFLGSKFFVGPKKFATKKIEKTFWIEKIFWVEKNFGFEKILAKRNFFVSKSFLDCLLMSSCGNFGKGGGLPLKPPKVNTTLKMSLIRFLRLPKARTNRSLSRIGNYRNLLIYYLKPPLNCTQ